MLAEPVLVVSTIARALDALSVAYVIGGSLASSVYGVPRATQDVDLVADLQADHVDRFCASLAQEFYVDADMIRDAIQSRTSFNIVHLKTMFKADIFIFKRDSWSREEMRRARTIDLHEAPSLKFASPEDTLLHKLIWYKLGNEISDRQWSDIQGILKVQGTNLDFGYLEHWAYLLGVEKLLQRARAE